MNDEDIDNPSSDPSDTGPIEYYSVEYDESVQDQLVKAEQALMPLAGVRSVGLGYGPAGTRALVVGVTDTEVASQLPAEVEGLPIIATVIGEVDALNK